MVCSDMCDNKPRIGAPALKRLVRDGLSGTANGPKLRDSARCYGYLRRTRAGPLVNGKEGRLPVVPGASGPAPGCPSACPKSTTSRLSPCSSPRLRPPINLFCADRVSGPNTPARLAAAAALRPGVASEDRKPPTCPSIPSQGAA
ncbi:hypothetical protein TOPH_03736 [Tolypocladium ophioglossoides CBS 100239]|uniref:Uncharacterized protein n=1 Tax=Tolypocladium ophioglossoides (strain CBS 100239) TaxID=1163406 RepID=A0A0L0NBL4_TOLOC|nr:hypothetical protein TOPH_03736 [Tolypocladium ophioglossoides CBS 100239]